MEGNLIEHEGEFYYTTDRHFWCICKVKHRAAYERSSTEYWSMRMCNDSFEEGFGGYLRDHASTIEEAMEMIDKYEEKDKPRIFLVFGGVRSGDDVLQEELQGICITKEMAERMVWLLNKHDSDSYTEYWYEEDSYQTTKDLDRLSKELE